MKKILLFDFDGVIVDTLEISYSIITKDFKYKITKEQYKDRQMGNVYKAIKKENKKEDIQARIKKWYSIYEPKVLKLKPVVGITKALKQLDDKYTMVVISSSINSPIHAYLEKHNLHHYFDQVYGADVHLDKGEKIKMVLKQYQAKAKQCLFITDTVGDLLEAKSKKIDSLVVTWGYHQKRRFNQTPPYAFISHPNELNKKVDQYFSDIKR